ncbi:MAG: NCS2 family permease [bacterium]|nr:NCS2 family permease [bacterium]
MKTSENGSGIAGTPLFGIAAAGSSVRREVLGGLTTFMTMSYILVVNPMILADGGMPAAGAFLATALAAAFATFLMGLLCDLPIALAPGMGLNAFFAYTICAGDQSWQAGLGLVVIVSLIFLLLTVSGVRHALTKAVPPSLRFGAGVGIGLFIALIGLKESGIVVDDPVTLVRMGNLATAHATLAVFGLVVTLGLMARGGAAAIFWGMVITAIAGAALGLVRVDGAWFALPSWDLPGLQIDLIGALRTEYIPLGATLLFFALFDAMGTLYAVGAEANLLDENGDFPRLGRALSVDASGALVGGLLGTSSVTCYIESATGVNVGARTGLASVVTASLFLLSLFALPLVSAVGAGVASGAEIYHPVTAPALITVGILMCRSVVRIPWDDFSEAAPAFLCLLVMPFTFSIANGLAVGFVSYATVKLFAGRAREVHPIVYTLAVLFVVYFAIGR